MIVFDETCSLHDIEDQHIPGGSGGEGRVCRVRGKNDRLAKIYHAGKLTKEHEDKLAAMLANPPKQPRTHIAVTWPEHLLYQQKNLVGFMMPWVKGGKEIHHIHNPVERKKLVPALNLKFIHHVALNLVRAVHSVHARGYVIGDINEKNILVNDRALVTLIDTDSFQITDVSGKIYRGTVGVLEYTPPELQDVKLSGVERTQAHDRFGLAVLLFKLLMEGRHPFNGVMKEGQVTGKLDIYCIRKGIFPYYHRDQAAPPPNAPGFDWLEPEIQDLFVKCFVDGHSNPESRPTAKEWRETLKRAGSDLKTCGKDANHSYYGHRRSCPWCTVKQDGTKSQKQKRPVRQPVQTIGSSTYTHYSTQYSRQSQKPRHSHLGWITCGFIAAAFTGYIFLTGNSSDNVAPAKAKQIHPAEARRLHREGWEIYHSQSKRRARKYFERSCGGENVRGCLALSYVLFRGEGGRQDPERARDLYEKTCKSRDLVGPDAMACKQFVLKETFTP